MRKDTQKEQKKQLYALKNSKKTEPSFRRLCFFYEIYPEKLFSQSHNFGE